MFNGAVEIVRARHLVDVGNAVGKARPARTNVTLRKVSAAQHHAIGIAVDGKVTDR